jgi:hypothetical protein
MELDDTQLKIIADDLDIALQRLCIEHKMPPLQLSAVTLARLIHLNGAVDSKEDFGKLLLSVGNSLLNEELDKPESIH